MTPSVAYELYAGTDGLARLRSAWESLEGAGADHIFQTHSHAELWHRTIGTLEGAKPLVVALVESGRVVGIFPACRVRQSGVPLITWLGAPRVLDYGDIIFDGAAAETPVDEFVAQSLRLLARESRGSLLYLPNVRSDARASEALRSRLRVLTHGAAPFLQTTGTWDGYLAAGRRKLRQDLERARRRLSEGGEVEFRLLSAGDPGIPPALESLVSFQRQRFSGRLDRTTLFDERYVRFREEQMADPAARVATLTLDGRHVAVSLAALFRGRLYHLVHGIDRTQVHRSPGSLLNGFLIRSCFENGWDTCDMGWGDEAWKHRWTDSVIQLTTFVSDDIKGATLSAAAGMRHRAIDVLGRLRTRSAAR